MKRKTILIIDALLIVANALCIVFMPGNSTANWLAIGVIGFCMYNTYKFK